jgi:NO-binding membrane sensor protein with MHYT domain
MHYSGLNARQSRGSIVFWVLFGSIWSVEVALVLLWAAVVGLAEDSTRYLSSPERLF